MQKIRWVVLSVLGLILLLACSAETVPPTATTTPPTAIPPTIASIAPTEVSTTSTEAPAAPTEASITPTEVPAAPEASIAPTEAPVTAAIAQGITIDGYTNALYTEANGDQIGNTDHAQLVSIYARW